MFFATLLAYLPYMAVTAFTPGPNNLVALYAIGQNGWRKGKQTIFGIAAGFVSVMLLCAVFCYELARYIPAIVGVMKYVGAAYILWLAVHVARSKPSDQQGQSVSFWKGFFLQFANAKIILGAVTAYTGYVLPVSNELPVLIGHAFCFTAMGMAGTITWAAAGGFLQSFLAKHHRPFCLVMGLVLALCAVQLVL